MRDSSTCKPKDTNSRFLLRDKFSGPARMLQQGWLYTRCLLNHTIDISTEEVPEGNPELGQPLKDRKSVV